MGRKKISKCVKMMDERHSNIINKNTTVLDRQTKRTGLSKGRNQIVEEVSTVAGMGVSK